MGGRSEVTERPDGPVRRCVGCGREREKGALLRVVRGKDGTVGIDVTGKAPGRGAYLCAAAGSGANAGGGADVGCVRAAAKKNSLSRSFRSHVDRDIYEKLSEIL
ncbi:hypothetical protein FACS1894167_02120 [Synergistales bacterium]|nr:hypothetical protein FACS1894167_02120 [Synergistales bacterium]GHV49733.1 hypothetical protein FACS1894216_00660 [Synergistales bacterium]